MKIAIVKSTFCKAMSLIVVVIFLYIMRDIYLPVNFGLFQPLIFHRSLLIDTLSHIPQSRFIENYYLLLPGEKWHWRQSVIIHLLQKIYSIGTQNYLAANALKMGKRLKDEVNDLLRKSGVSAFAWSGHLLQASTRGKLFLTSQIAKNLPEPVATLYSQILFGKCAGGSKELKHLFEITGTQHIAVVSGFNLTFLARFVTASLQLVLSKKQVAISVFFCVANVLCNGRNGSVGTARDDNELVFIVCEFLCTAAISPALRAGRRRGHYVCSRFHHFRQHLISVVVRGQRCHHIHFAANRSFR